MRRGEKAKKKCQDLCSLFAIRVLHADFRKQHIVAKGFRFVVKTYLGLDLFDLLSANVSSVSPVGKTHRKTRGHTFSTVVDMMPVVPNYATGGLLLMFPSAGYSSPIRETRSCRNVCGRRFCSFVEAEGQPKVLNLVMPNLFVCGGGGMNIFWMGFWWGKFLVCGLRVANDVSAFTRLSRVGKAGILL